MQRIYPIEGFAPIRFTKNGGDHMDAIVQMDQVDGIFTIGQALSAREHGHGVSFGANKPAKPDDGGLDKGCIFKKFFAGQQLNAGFRSGFWKGFFRGLPFDFPIDRGAADEENFADRALFDLMEEKFHLFDKIFRVVAPQSWWHIDD